MSSGESIPHRGDWNEQYQTTVSYGKTIPTPEDWVHNDYERGGLILTWKRYEDIGHNHTDDHEVVEAREFAKNAGTPDEDAMLAPQSEYEYVETNDGPERRPVADPADRELTINGETVLKVYDPYDEGELLAAVAAILERHSRSERYDKIVREFEMPDSGGNQTLDEWQ